MSEYLQPAECPGCRKTSLVYSGDRVRCINPDCNWCQHCEGPCKSHTAHGCRGPKGEPGEGVKSMNPAICSVRRIETYSQDIRDGKLYRGPSTVFYEIEPATERYHAMFEEGDLVSVAGFGTGTYRDGKVIIYL